MMWLIIGLLITLVIVSYFIIKDGEEQFDDDFDDPTETCWDDDKNHTEGGFH